MKVEQDRRNQLLEEVAAWRKALEVREYVSAVMEKVQRSDTGDSGASLTEWATWARAEADKMDPLVRSRV